MSAYQFPAAAPAGPTGPSADPTAVIGRRIGGWVVDFLLYSLIMAFLAPTPLSPLAEYYDDVPSSIDACEVLQEDGDAVGCLAFGDRVYVTDGTDAVIQFVVFVLVVLLYSALQGARGITPGKAIFGIKVVDEQGGHPGFGKSLARTLLWIVDLAPWCLPLVGFITGLSTKGHRRVGDMAAKTFVVGKGHTGPVAVPGMATAASGGYPGGYPGAPGQWGPPPGGAPGGPPSGWGGPPPAQQPGAWGAPTPGPGGPAGQAPAPDTRPAPPTDWTPPGSESPSSGGSSAPPSTPASSAAAPSGGRTEPPPTVEDPDARPTTDDASSSDAPPDGGDSGETPPASPAATSPSGSGPAGSSPTPASPAEGTPPGAAPSAEGTPPSAAQGGPAAGSPTPGSGDRPPATESDPAAATSAGAGAAAPSGYNPQWDAARGTYIVWEPNRGKWLGWDEATSEWKPL